MSTIPEIHFSFSQDEEIRSLISSSADRWDGDIDRWIEEVPEQDRESRLRLLLDREALTTSQQEKVYRRLTEISGKSRDYRQWGGSRVRRGDYEGALELYQQATAVAPADADSWFEQGRLQSRLNQIEEADQSIVQAIAHNPDRDDYYAALGYLNSIRGDSARARAAYQMALDRNPENGFAWYNLAVTDYNAGQFRSATDSFHNAGQFYLRQGRLDRVEQVLSDLRDIHAESRSRSASEAIDVLQERMKQWMNQQDQ